MKIKNKKVIVAMSGGVDSSVAAKLMQGRGFKTIGVFLHFWKESKFAGKTEFENKCCSTKAFLDASRVCHRIGIPLYTMNFGKIFKKEIVDNFINEYKRGNTPNPCARCNKLVKLGLLVKRGEKLGFDYVASGHYARSQKSKVKSQKYIYKLYKAKDKEKDQSYFLYNLTQEQLKHLIFPLGEFKKEEVRKMARRFGLPVHAKKDSQEVCFIPEKSHNEFLRRHIKMKPGPIKILNITSSHLKNGSILIPPLNKGGRRGGIIGEHNGLPLYTIGQRRGVEIGGTGPYYVAKLDYKKNILYVVNDARDKALYSDHLVAKNVNWISGRPLKMPFSCEAVIRYRHKPARCLIETSPNPVRLSAHDEALLRKEGEFFPPLRKGRVGRGYNCLVKFSQPQRAITPGQSVVFYKGDEVLGGGVIDKIKN